MYTTPVSSHDTIPATGPHGHPPPLAMVKEADLNSRSSGPDRSERPQPQTSLSHTLPPTPSAALLSEATVTSIDSPSLARRHNTARSRKHNLVHVDPLSVLSSRPQQQQQQHQSRQHHQDSENTASSAITPLSPLLQEDNQGGIPHHALPHLQPQDIDNNTTSTQIPEPSSSTRPTPGTPTRKPSAGALLLSIPQSLLRSTLGRQNSLRNNEQQPQDATLERLQHSHPLPTLDRDALQSLGRALTERSTTSPPSSLPVSPIAKSPLPEKVALSKAQLKQIAPTVVRQPDAARERLGVRPISTVSSAYEVDLAQFVPAMNMLSPAAASGPVQDLTPFEHSAKLDLLYQLLASRSPDGTIDANTIRNVLTEALTNNALYLSPGDLEILTDVLVAKLDVDGDGCVSAMDFKLATRSWNLAGIGLPAAPSSKANNIDIFGLDYLALDSGAARNNSQTPRSMKRRSRVRSASRWMMDRTPSQLWEPEDLRPIVDSSTSPTNGRSASSPSGPQTPSTPNLNAPLKSTHPTDARTPSTPVSSYLTLEGPKLICVFIFISCAFAVFTWRLIHLLSVSPLGIAVGAALAVASGTAHIVLLCVAFSFLLMCRRLLTLIRDIKLLEWVPVDKHVTWHKYVGWIATAAGTVHTLCHTFGVFPKLAGNNSVRAVAGLPPLDTGASNVGEYANLMFLSIPGSTGWALVFVFIIMVVTSTVRMRRSNFEGFWYTHHLYLLLPASLYTLDRVIRYSRTLSPATILHARIEGDTLSLVMARPCRWQWHPFTLTSAPSDPYLSVRIKRAGDWTGSVFDALAPVCVDGPFGASAQDFVNFDRVVFIATGVGATPFLAVLRHIEFLVKGQLQDEDARRSDEDDWDEEAVQRQSRGFPSPASTFSGSVNRDQQGFKWMSQALRDTDPRVLRLLRVHTFLTSAAQGTGELTSYLLWWGLQLAKEGPLGGRCALTGLQHSAQYWGRPSWEQVFEQLGTATPEGDQVGVFYCGPKALGKELYGLVRKENARGKGTFCFAKENF
ncbi:hypothetical protein BCR44DRAFT_1502990 [Catenaria anguillulae PL171]|uniref:Ferric reductase NAD binding domain-domain-containing protein n=1 Tax=Catenaria anguillulae PL171 TaxID=765915 RepID=A0A1Y2H9G4_9FUNG|nr:hypothetical protein BCR44DRAFT_1502990 [Catenaria anguillulae PL171]